MKIYDIKDDKGIGSQVEARLCDNDMHLIIVVCKTQKTKGFQGQNIFGYRSTSR